VTSDLLAKAGRLKQRLRNRLPVAGGWLTVPDLAIAELMATAGLDFVLLDCEHGSIDVGSLPNVLVAFEATETVPIVRVPSNDALAIRRALDFGAAGVVVPFVESAEAARQAVRAGRYPPEGDRGFGPRRAARYYRELSDYLANANDSMITFAQIETASAVDAIGEIIDVPGIDCIFVGWSDLSGSLGYLRERNNPALAAAIDKVSAACRAHGIALCLGVATGKEAVAMREQGATVYLAADDLLLLRDALGDAVTQLNDVLGR